MQTGAAGNITDQILGPGSPMQSSTGMNHASLTAPHAAGAATAKLPAQHRVGRAWANDSWGQLTSTIRRPSLVTCRQPACKPPKRHVRPRTGCSRARHMSMSQESQVPLTIACVSVDQARLQRSESNLCSDLRGFRADRREHEAWNRRSNNGQLCEKREAALHEEVCGLTIFYF